MSVYVAGPYAARAALARVAADLIMDGHYVRARWLSGLQESAGDNLPAAHPDDRVRWAEQDLHDIDVAHLVVAFTAAAAWETAYRYAQNPGNICDFGASGGRHVETGYALARNIPVVLVGSPENLFHWHPQIRCHPTWRAARVALRKHEAGQ